MKIYYVRHGKTVANDSNKWQGLSDLKLSEEGLSQIEHLKELSRDMDIDIIFTSPLIRAQQTAHSLKHSDKTKIIISEKIIERNFGDLEMSDVDENDKLMLANWNMNTNLNKNVEKIREMYENRIKPFLLEIKNKYSNSDKKIVIVSHSWVGRLIAFFASNELDTSVIQVTPKHAKIYEYEI